MTSPFVDRVEYQVIGRDVNASGVFRDVANAADAAGDSITGLGSDLDRVNRSIEDTADRMRQLVASLEDLSATREITVTTNVREVLGSVEDNRQVLDLVNDRFETMTVNVTATVNQLVQLNDGLTTIDDNRTAVIDLGDDVLTLTQNITATVDSVVDLNDGLTTVNDNRNVIIDLGDDVRQLTQSITATVDSVVELNDGLQSINDNRTAVIDLGDDVVTLTQNITATVDSVVALNDGLQTIDDNRTAVITLDDDFQTLTQSITATVDSVVNLNDGIQTIDDNRTAVITLDGDFQTLTQSITATVDSVVNLNDGIQTIDDNRNVIVTVDDDFRNLTQSITATVDSVVALNDGIQTIDDNRAVIVTVDDDFRTLTQDINGTVNSIVNLNDGIQTVDDNRTAITGVGDDFRNIGTDAEGSRQVIIRFNDEVARVDDNRNAITGLGDGFDELGTDIERTRGRVIALNRDIERTGDIDIDRDIDIGRQIVETVSSDRDRLERAGLVAGAALGAGLLTSINAVLTGGLGNIPFVGEFIKKISAAIAASSGVILAALSSTLYVAAAAAAVIVANVLTAGVLLALAGGAIAAGIIASLGNDKVKEAAKFTGQTIASTLRDAAEQSGFTDALEAGLIQIREQFPQLKAGLTGLFAAAGPLMKPLIDGILGFAREALPGMTEALRNSKPIIDKLAEWLPRLGKTFGDFFARISEVSPQAASALGAMLSFVDSAVKAIGEILVSLGKLEPLAELFFGIVRFLAGSSFGAGLVALNAFASFIEWLFGSSLALGQALETLARSFATVGNGLKTLVRDVPGLATALGAAGVAGGVLGGAFGALKSPTDGAGAALGRATAKAKGATDKFNDMTKAIRDAIGAANEFIGVGDAQASMYEAMERGAKRVADASGKDLKKGIDLSTAAGRENWKALRDIASGANAAAQDILDMNGTQADAAAVTQVARAAFLKTAASMGITGKYAQDLADDMFGIPDADPKVTLQDKATKGIGGIDHKLDGLDAYNAVPRVGLLDLATAGIKRIQTLLYRTDGQTATVTVNVERTGGAISAASGGPVLGPGPKGVDSKLYMLAPGEHILSAREVDAAGGHAAVMEFRRSLLNRGTPRGMGVAEQAAAGRSHGRGGIDAQTLRQALSGMTLVIDDRTGRTAQLIARGG